MIKDCPEHGTEEGLVERDLEFFREFGFGRDVPMEQELLMINITDFCNTRCRLCYYPLGQKHKPKEWVLEQARRFGDYHVVFSGGEPTCHPDIIELIDSTPNFHACITNGLKFADPEFTKAFMEVTKGTALGQAGYLPVEFSVHPEAPKARLEVLASLRKQGIRVPYAFFSVCAAAEVEQVSKIWLEWRDVIANIRIRTPYNLWNQKAEKTLFLSDVYRECQIWFPQFQPTEILGGNSIYSLNLECAGRHLTLCCSPSLDAMDVNHIGGAPKALAEDGQVYPAPLAMAVNEGMTKGLHY